MMVALADDYLFYFAEDLLAQPRGVRDRAGYGLGHGASRWVTMRSSVARSGPGPSGSAGPVRSIAPYLPRAAASRARRGRRACS